MMWNDLSDYILKNYDETFKIVEVGVGGFPRVALKLKEHHKMNIILTDIKPSHEGVVKDDITDPNLKIYGGASLIYSIRPPEELQPYIFEVAEAVGSDLIIKPLSTEFLNTKKNMKLINYKKAVFYKMCKP